MTRRPPITGTPVWAALFVALVLVSSLVSLSTVPEGRITSTWWPAVGFSIALLALTPRTWWPLLLLTTASSTAVSGIVNDAPPVYIVAFSLNSALETWAGAAILRWGRQADQVRLTTQADGLRLGLATCTGAAISASGSALVARLDGSRSPGEVALAIFPSHLASALVVLLLVLAVRSPQRRVPTVELLLQTTVFTLALAVIFLPEQHPGLSVLPLPLLIWAAYRFGLRAVSWQVAMMAAAVGLLTASGHGPFTTYDGTELNVSLVATLTQAYLICAVLACVPVAVGMHTHDLLERQLRASTHLSDITMATTASIVLVTDVHGTVLRANRAVTTLLGHDVDAIVGRPVWETLVDRESQERVRRIFDPPDGSRLPSNADVGWVRDVNDNEHRIIWSTGIVHDEDGVPTYLVMTGLDVTAERTATGLMEHLLGAELDTAIIGTSPAGTVTLFNSGAQTLLGRTPAQVIGAPFTDLLVPDELEVWARSHDVAPDFDALAQHLTGRPPQEWEWPTSPGADAPRRRVSMSLTRITDRYDRLLGFLCIGNDVTDAHATAELLTRALEKERHVVDRLTALDSAKDDFVSTVSHELRTPVATIVGYGEMLTDGDLGSLTPPQTRALHAIVRNGERLVDLVDNLLALSNVGSDAPSTSRGPVDLRDVMGAVEQETTGLLVGRELTVTFEQPTEQVLVLGDPVMLRLALVNLTRNAVKFTPDGGSVLCRLEVHGTHACLVVRDTGWGIPESEQEHLFERFWRSSTAQEHQIQGTGLGLPTVRGIVLSHEGTIEVESSEGAGTTVTLLLPLHQEERSRVTSEPGTGEVTRG